MKTIHIPNTIAALKKGLGGLDRLLTATQWEKAAIVFAWTREGTQGGNTSIPKSKDARLTPTGFAKEGIAGLTSDTTVREYRKAWAKAVDAGHVSADIKPGDTVALPDLTWSDYFQSVGGASTPAARERIAREVMAEKPALVASAVKALPQVADAVMTAVVDDNELANKHARMSMSKRMTGKTVDKGPVPESDMFRPTDYTYDKAVAKAIGVIDQAINDEEAGVWTPEAGSVALLSVLFLRLKTRAERFAEAQPAVHGDIEDFLASTRGE